MTLFKGTIVGIASLVVTAIVWRLVVGAFVIGIALLKIVLFVIVPILLLVWIVNKLVANGTRSES